MRACAPKTGWISGDTYCAVHGRAAGWPCAEERPAYWDEPITINGQPTTLREAESAARLNLTENNPTWEHGMARTILYLLDRLRSERAEADDDG